MPRSSDDDGSIVVALLLTLSLGALSLVLLASSVSHVRTANRDTGFTGVLPAADAGINQGLLLLNSGQAASLPPAPQTLVQGGRTTRWSSATTTHATLPPVYALTSTSEAPARTLRAEAWQRRRFAVAAFADQAVIFRGGNTADSYNSATGVDLTGQGRVGSNDSVTLNGGATANGVDLYDWLQNANPGRCSNPAGTACSPTNLTRQDERLDITSAASTSFIRAKTATCTTGPLSTTGPTTLAPGEHCFSSVTLRGDLTITGPTTIYVSGDVFIDHHLKINYVSPGPLPVAANLQIYLLGTSFDMSNHTTIGAAVYAPLATCYGGAQSIVYGSLICGRISNNGGWQFHYDEALGQVGDGQFRIRNYREA